MKTSIQAVLIATSVLLLAACASSGGMASAAPQPYQTPDEVSTDAAYMAAVERVARRRGVSVRWLNPPVKRVEAGVDDETDAL